MGKTMANREVADLVLYDYTTGVPFLNIDYANVTTNEHTATSVYAKGGKGGANRVRFDGERTSTLKITTQVIDFDLMAMLAGAEVASGVNVFKRETLAADADGKITLSDTPVSGSIYVFAEADDCGAAIEFTAASGVLTLTGGEEDAQYIAYYQAESVTGSKKIEFKSNQFPKAYKLVGETRFKHAVSEAFVPFQIVAYKAQPQSGFSMSFSNTGDPSSFEITFDLLADKDGNILDYILL